MDLIINALLYTFQVIQISCDTTNTTLLMRVLPVDKLPTIWGSNIVSKYGCRSNTTAETVSTDPTKLSDREKVLYFIIKSSNFFVNLFIIKNSNC